MLKTVFVRETESARQMLPVLVNCPPATFLTHRWPAYTTRQSTMSLHGSQVENGGIVLTIKGCGSRRMFNKPRQGMTGFHGCDQGALQV